MKKNIFTIVAALGLAAAANAQSNETNVNKKANIFVQGYKAIETNVVKCYTSIQNGVVMGYKAVESASVKGYAAVENNVVQGWNKVEDKCVDVLFKHEDETVEEAKRRLNSKKTDYSLNIKR